jgi:hypothetical protein
VVFEVTSEWAELDPIDTREEMRVVRGVSVGAHSVGSTGDVVDYETEFKPSCVLPLYDDTWAVGWSPGSPNQATSMSSTRWLTTPMFPLGFPDRLDLATYSGSMFITGAASHLHDFDPTQWMSDKEDEVRATVEAATGGTIVSFEWEISGDGPFGEYASRQLEYAAWVLGSATYERDGTLISGGTFFDADPIAIHAIPADEHETDDYEFPLDGDEYPFVQIDNVTVTGGMDGAWRDDGFESRSGEDSVSTFMPGDLLAVADVELAEPAEVDNVVVEIDDAWFEANAWPANGSYSLARFNDYQSRGVPVYIVPRWMTDGTSEDSPNAPFEADVSISTAMRLWLRSVWTPPRYRYTLEYQGGVPPRRGWPSNRGYTAPQRGFSGHAGLSSSPRGWTAVV